MFKTAGPKSNHLSSFSHLNLKNIDKKLPQVLKIVKCKTPSEMGIMKDSGCQTNFKRVRNIVHKSIAAKVNNVLKNDNVKPELLDEEGVDLNKRFIIVNISNAKEPGSHIKEYSTPIEENQSV